MVGGKWSRSALCRRTSSYRIDGLQHLSNADAYRRDRRKDLLLLENDYFVLRFLAEDVSKQLEMVLDTILRTLSHRRKI